MKRLNLLFIFLLFCSSTVFSQSFSVVTQVDSLDENYYKLSYTFSDTVSAYEEQESGLPFPFFMTTPEDKFTVDSTWVNEARTEFEVFLNTEVSNNYMFLSNNVLSKDSLYLEEPTLINFVSVSGKTNNLTITGNYVKSYPITKTTYSTFNNVINTTALLSSFLFVFDTWIKQSSVYDSLRVTLKENGPWYFKTEQFIELSKHQLLGGYHLKSWIDADAEILYNEHDDLTYYIQNGSNPGFYEDLAFTVNTASGDSLIFLFIDTAYSREANYNSVTLAHIYDGNELLNITSSMEDLNIINIFPVSIESDGSGKTIIDQIALSAYPNPFNPSTQLQYTLPEAGNITISVFNVLGQQVRTLAEGTRSSGAHTTTFNATGLPAGMYVVRLESTGQSGKVFTETKKVMLLK